MAEIEGRLVGIKHACFLRGVITRQESMATMARFSIEASCLKTQKFVLLV